MFGCVPPRPPRWEKLVTPGAFGPGVLIQMHASTTFDALKDCHLEGGTNLDLATEVASIAHNRLVPKNKRVTDVWIYRTGWSETDAWNIQFSNLANDEVIISVDVRGHSGLVIVNEQTSSMAYCTEISLDTQHHVAGLDARVSTHHHSP